VSEPAAVGVIVWVPLLARVPVQLPDAVQLVAPVEDQVIVVEFPTVIEVAAKVSVGAAGAGGAVTAKTTETAVVVPSTLLQTREYVSDPTSAGVRTWLPLVGNGPLQLPDALQLAAVSEDQEIVADSPRVIEVAESVRLGTAGATVVKLTEFDADTPAALVQVKMY
jgi:hypothetical protein